ncbi:hypothetical protein C0J52_19330 [Blattella germanica]|nr:hypothetical protein C0J52_19330 [Blattella germanica]
MIRERQTMSRKEARTVHCLGWLDIQVRENWGRGWSFVITGPPTKYTNWIGRRSLKYSNSIGSNKQLHSSICCHEGTSPS